MHSKLLALIVLLLLPCLGNAQDTLPNYMADHLYFGPAHFANAQDSAEFARFRNGLETVDPTAPTDTTKTRYRMVWQEDQHGGLWMVSRGDGSLLIIAVNGPIAFFEGHAFRTSDGRRGIMVVHDTPCGLVCRSAWYYVEE